MEITNVDSRGLNVLAEAFRCHEYGSPSYQAIQNSRFGRREPRKVIASLGQSHDEGCLALENKGQGCHI
jgi:hypothetical protein